jgi:hypothetical protein
MEYSPSRTAEADAGAIVLDASGITDPRWIHHKVEECKLARAIDRARRQRRCRLRRQRQIARARNSLIQAYATAPVPQPIARPARHHPATTLLLHEGTVPGEPWRITQLEDGFPLAFKHDSYATYANALRAFWVRAAPAAAAEIGPLGLVRLSSKHQT